MKVVGAIPERSDRLGEDLAPRRVGGVPRAVARLSIGSTRLRPIPFWSAVGGHPVRLGEVCDANIYFLLTDPSLNLSAKYVGVSWQSLRFQRLEPPFVAHA